MKIDPETLALLPFEVRAEIAENTERLDFKPSEIDTIRQRCEDIFRKQAKKRQGARTDIQESFPESERGETRDKVGALVGVSGRTVEKIAAVVAAAKADPERFGKLRDDMDRSWRVDAPYRRLKVARQAEAIRKERPPLPQRGPYRVIVADPPWDYQKRQEDPSHRGIRPYPSMSVAQICAMPVATLAHADCSLWLWTTNAFMRDAFEVLDAWGFKQKTILTWIKDRVGLGDWLRGQTEHALLAVRGKPTVVLTTQSTALHAPARAHSRKPEEFYAFVEKLCPAPLYCEIFSRHSRPNWDGHGDEYVAAGQGGS